VTSKASVSTAFLFFGRFLAVLFVGAADATSATAGDAANELTKLEVDWAAAVETNDPDRIASFFADDFLFVGAGGILQNREEHLDDFRSGRLKIVSVKLGPSTVHVHGDAAVVSSQVGVEGKFGPRNISGAYQFTDTWRETGGRWLALARQQTRVASSDASNKVREFFAAFAKGNIAAVLDTMSNDIEWFIPGPSSIPYAGKRRGRDQVQLFFSAFADAVDVQQFEPLQFIEQGDTVVVLGHEILRVKTTGRTVDNQWAMVFTVKDKIDHFRSYEDTAALAAAFSAKN
jgi:hypothetical protein